MDSNYVDFSERILKRVSVLLGEDYDVSLEKVLKNNSCEYLGMVIRHIDNNEEAVVTPAIYMYQWYERYLAGTSEEDIAKEVVNTYYTGKEIGKSINLEDINSTNARQKLYYRLVNKNRNEDMLNESPHIEFLDLVLIFYYLCSEDTDGIQSFRITNRIMEEWHMNTTELCSYANDNMEKLFPGKTCKINDVIEEMTGDDFVPDEGVTVPIYVLTNIQGINGAAALLYSTRLQELAENLNSDIYILPSSIHEVLLVPADTNICPDNLRTMVLEVNSSQVIPEEQLSDNVYYYSRHTEKITICN